MQIGAMTAKIGLEETECMQETAGVVETEIDGERGKRKTEDGDVHRKREDQSTGVDSSALTFSHDRNQCYKGNSVSSLYT